MIVENNHEPIISRELWDKVHEYEKSVSRGKKDSRGFVQTFSGLLYCADCGYKMKQIRVNRRNKEHGTAYTCGYHARYGSIYCTTHTINGKVLEALVVADIRSKLQLIVDEERARKQFLQKKSGDRTTQSAADTKRTRETERLEVINQDERDVDEFIRRLKKYAEFEILTREMLLDLVEYITIEDSPENRNTPRKIHIYYKFLDKKLTNKQNALL